MSCMGGPSGCSFYGPPPDDSIVRLGPQLGSKKTHPKATRVEYEVLENMRKQQEILQEKRPEQVRNSYKVIESWEDFSNTDVED